MKLKLDLQVDEYQVIATRKEIEVPTVRGGTRAEEVLGELF